MIGRIDMNDAKTRSLLANILCEQLSLLEMTSMKLFKEHLTRSLPTGDGHPVLVLPAMLMPNKLMASLRSQLEQLGYDVYAPKQIMTTGLTDDIYQTLNDYTDSICQNTGKQVSIIGHSIGGIYARVLATRNKALVRQVISLCAPFLASDELLNHSQIARIYKRFNPQVNDNQVMTPEQFSACPGVPTTSIYTRFDGIIPWGLCLDRLDALTDNIRILGTHVGMAHNIFACYVIADRLAQKEREWRPFKLEGLNNLFYVKDCVNDIKPSNVFHLAFNSKKRVFFSR